LLSKSLPFTFSSAWRSLLFGAPSTDWAFLFYVTARTLRQVIHVKHPLSPEHP